MDKINLLNFDFAGLEGLCADWEEKPFRAKQWMRWIHQFGVSDFSLMTDLPAALRARMNQVAEIVAPTMTSSHQSSDGTCKWLFDVGAGNAVESVYIPEARRGTLCISTQAGCAVNCRFCSTGRQGFNRNLSVAEIIGQLWFAEFNLRRNTENTDTQTTQLTRSTDNRVVTNVVLMGMGEPLLNYDNVVPALRLMLDDRAYGLSRRRVTLSTSGVVPMIDRLAQDCPVALAVSLHAPTDQLRDSLVPLNKKYPLRELMAACRRYLEFAPRDYVTFEYCMLDGVNDREIDARALIDLVQDVPCKFNLIPFNPYPESGLRTSSVMAIARFTETLQNANIVTTVRKTRGDDINAACGQLVGEVKNRIKIPVRVAA